MNVEKKGKAAFWLTIGLVSMTPSVSLAEARHLQSYVWTIDNSAFGGISAIDITDDGTSFVAIGDRGRWIKGTFIREGGRITGIDATTPRKLKSTNGRPVDRVQDGHDAEGLAIAPDGTTYVSFELLHRILRYDDLSTAATAELPAPDLAPNQWNAGMEALALDSDGRLLALQERSGRARRATPVHRSSADGWQTAFHLPRIDAFVPVGADLGPDGWLYVLERDFAGAGFRSRVRRIRLDGTDPEVVFQTGPLTFDNLEGIAVWRDDTGAIRLTMVSDDNFMSFQETQIVEYRLDP